MEKKYEIWKQKQNVSGGSSVGGLNFVSHAEVFLQWFITEMGCVMTRSNVDVCIQLWAKAGHNCAV